MIVLLYNLETDQKELQNVPASLEQADLLSCHVDAPDKATADYLGSFNIDMGMPADDVGAPHYIINLNVYGSDGLGVPDDSGLEGLAAVPVGGPLPSTSSQPHSESLESDDKSPAVPTVHPYLRPMGRSRMRGRGGRFNAIPIDDVLEKKIMTFEGRDCVQHLEELQRLFPRFKKAYINRIFTRNVLNYEKTFQELSELDKIEEAKLASIRLVQCNKTETKRSNEPKPKCEISPLNPQTYLYLGVPLGRCPPHIANTLYRRVIVNPDGSVVPADIQENKFLDRNGLKPRRPLLFPPPPRPDLDGNFPLIPSLYGPRLPTPTGSPVSKPLFTPTSVLSNTSDGATSATSKTILPPKCTALGDPIPRPPGNRFFRTNRLCETEIKKRGYVDRELRNASAIPGSVKRSKGSNVKETDNTSTVPEPKEADAIKNMESVGVVSTPIPRKRGLKSKHLTEQEITSKAESDVFEPVTDSLNLTLEERKKILEFFNQARLEELMLLPGCSRKTGQILASLRPFRHTGELVNRLSGTRHLSLNLIDGSKEILQMRSTVVRLMQRCERITERVAAHASRLLANNVSLSSSDEKILDYSKTPEDKAEQLLTQQPAILNPLRELKPYQLVGLNWLRLLHHEQVNGILADEMGLGKTIQAIAFLASLWESGDRGPHLVVCPSSTQDNWLRELSDWCSHLKVLVYQGSAEQRKAIRLKIYEAGAHPDFNILLTSYAIGTSTIEDRALMKRVNFHYGIFDEAHMLKNMSSQRYRVLSNFRVQRRLLLTGTPLQNNLLELISLLSFLMPEMFARSTDLLKRMFHIYSKSVGDHGEVDGEDFQRSNFEVERAEQIKNLLQPFFLRRLKSQVLSQLPPKSTEIIRVPMTDSQAKHYWILVDRLRQATRTVTAKNGIRPVVESKVNSDGVGDENVAPIESSPLRKNRTEENYVVNGTDVLDSNERPKAILPADSPSNMIVQLRKAANHQALLSGIAFSEVSLRDIAETLHLDPSHSSSDPQLIFEDLVVLSDHQVHKICQFYDILSPYTLPMESIMSGSGKLTWLNENIPKFIKAGHRLLIFSQFVVVLDLLEEFLRSKDQRYLRLDGNTPVVERQELVDRFNSSSIEVFLLSTRAGGLGINLTGADMVIIHDIDFNPYNDKQAEDRAHRLGQIKPVHVIRLISEKTVEEGILRIATEKLELEQGVTGGSKAEMDDQEAECDETVVEEDLTESADVVMKIIGSPNQSPTKRKHRGGSSRTFRLNDQEVWSLLEDALKPIA